MGMEREVVVRYEKVYWDLKKGEDKREKPRESNLDAHPGQTQDDLTDKNSTPCECWSCIFKFYFQ